MQAGSLDPASVAEEKQQIQSAPLHALKELLLRAGALDHVGLQPEPRRQLVFEDEVGLILIADALLHFQEQALSHLLPYCQQRGGAALRGRRDLEDVQPERAADRARELG